jgi:hypothetical protein
MFSKGKWETNMTYFFLLNIINKQALINCKCRNFDVMFFKEADEWNEILHFYSIVKNVRFCLEKRKSRRIKRLSTKFKRPQKNLKRRFLRQRRRRRQRKSKKRPNRKKSTRQNWGDGKWGREPGRTFPAANRPENPWNAGLRVNIAAKTRAGTDDPHFKGF